MHVPLVDEDVWCGMGRETGDIANFAVEASEVLISLAAAKQE